MRFSVCTTSIALAVAALISPSCEKHSVGEMPEVQTEHVDLAPGEKEATAHPEHSPTPAEFFPESTPQ